MNRVQFSRPQPYPAAILRAFAVSLALHLAVVGASELSQRFRAWKQGPLNQRWKSAQQKSEKSAVIPPGAKKNPLTTDSRDVTVVLVDIDPIPVATAAPSPTKPIQSKNPEPKRVDLIATQTKHPPLEMVQALPVQPPPPPLKDPLPSEIANPAAKGDLNLADPRSEKSQTKPIVATNAAQASKPASTENQSPPRITAASAVKPVGVSEKPTPPPRPSLVVDLKAGPFSAYDTAIVAAVQKRWYELLDERKTAREGKGRVVVEFRLKYDGHISELKITYREVDDILSLICQRAVTDPAPFAAWPRELRRTAAANYRNVRFTFVY